LPTPEGWKAKLAYRWLITDGLPARKQSPIQVL